MGPYYLTALRRSSGRSPRHRVGARHVRGAHDPQRAPRRQRIPVAVPTHVAGVLDFAGGPIATMMTSFDVWAAEVPRLEIYGAEGTLSVPDPNTFGGPVRVRRARGDWRELPLTHPFADNSRGLGLADMAAALREGRPHRASGELAYHVLEVMHAVETASRQGRHVTIESAPPRPAPL